MFRQLARFLLMRVNKYQYSLGSYSAMVAAISNLDLPERFFDLESISQCRNTSDQYHKWRQLWMKREIPLILTSQTEILKRLVVHWGRATYTRIKTLALWAVMNSELPVCNSNTLNLN